MPPEQTPAAGMPDPLIAGLRTTRFAHGLCCPRCHADRVHRWGSFAGRQRYRCCECRRTFSDLTGTPASYVKKIALWPAYAVCLRRGLSVRRAAARLGIHPTTAFRWRHTLLRAIRARDVDIASGWIEVELILFAHSEKGSRRLRRLPRRRGPRPGWRRQDERVRVALACDRTGTAISAVLPCFGAFLYFARAIDEVLGGRITGRAAVTARQGRFGPVGVFARRRRLPFHDARSSGRSPRAAMSHTETVLAYRDRMLSWIRRFRGVSTKYLANYLMWHRAVDVPYRLGIERNVLRWPLQPG